VSLVTDLIKNFEPQIESITLIPSTDGKFEISINNQSVYSKLETGRHAEPGEVVKLVRKFITK
jgi:selenoprotein W-related protein